MDEGEVIILSRRLGIMMIALIAPELMITWATIQFLTARDTVKDFDDAFGAQRHQAPAATIQICERVQLCFLVKFNIKSKE